MQLPTSTKNKEYKHSPRGSWAAGLLTLAVSSTPALSE